MKAISASPEARTGAVLAASVALVAGCGASSPRRTPGVPEPPPGRSSWSQPHRRRLGASTSAVGAPPAPTATPVPPEPAAVMSLWLDAIEPEDWPTQRAVTAEAAGALTAERDIVRQENRRRGATTADAVRITQPPRTTDASADTAHVSLRATLTSVVSGPKGSRPEQ